MMEWNKNQKTKKKIERYAEGTTKLMKWKRKKRRNKKNEKHGNLGLKNI